ncbi:MAG TPA: hypothetical protein VIN67_07855, partial [Desulfobaccales bacterium]
GCGATTLTFTIRQELSRRGIQTQYFDLSSPQGVLDAMGRLQAISPRPPQLETKAGEPAGAEPAAPLVLIMDNAAGLPREDLAAWLNYVQEKVPALSAACLWVGPWDARSIYEDFRVRLHAVPRSHITFPILSRDEALAVYRAIGEANGCVWGEAILFLLLDFCGNDLSLVRGAAEYLYGDWSDRLYDVNVWDRVGDWLAHDLSVQHYRGRLQHLPESSRLYLNLIRLGGKPPCLRAELLEEVNPDLRRLSLQGFLVPNLLPGFYQLRNLTIRFLLQEPFKPEFLFRRAANERVAQLLQDVETMLRSVLFHVFGNLEAAEVRQLLERKQGEREFMPADLNKKMLEWASEKGGPKLREEVGTMLARHRLAFKTDNSVWARVIHMMQVEESEEENQPVPEHLRVIDYLTFGELGEVLLALIDRVFPGIADKPPLKAAVKQRWQESIAKVRRLRNRVAHLRNVAFQDMEDLVGTVEGMRKDLMAYAGWR